MIHIGIDPGVHTGFAVLWDGKLTEVKSMAAVEAEDSIIYISSVSGNEKLIVHFEDARLRNWFGSKGKEALQGAGSIKRDCQRWQEFLEYHNIPYAAIAPRQNKTKMKADYFQRITGWEGRTNEHGRDAAMLVFGRK